MNTRIKNKITKRNNTNKINSLLSKIEYSGFTINDKQFRDTYFLFFYGANSICHFTLNKLPDWKFGIWLLKDGYRVFCEHKLLLDKFKPSRGYITTDNIWEMIKWMGIVQLSPKKHFLLSSGYSYDDLPHNIDEVYQAKVNNYKLDEIDNNEIYDREYKVVRGLFKSISNLNNVSYVGVIDKEKHIFYLDDRYEVYIVLNDIRDYSKQMEQSILQLENECIEDLKGIKEYYSLAYRYDFDNHTFRINTIIDSKEAKTISFDYKY